MKTLVKSPVEQCEMELFRFFIIAGEYRRKTGMPAFMPACKVDNIWHDLLLDKDRYSDLSRAAVGEVLLHIEANGAGEIEWVPYYENAFGKLSELWFADADGKVDGENYQAYLKSGKMYAAWDCTPAGGNDGDDRKPICPQFMLI